ncbi:MAG: anti-sigma factor [Phycisphaerae bacterium]
MTCREVIDFLMTYQNGELPEAQRRLFEQHIALCPPCVQYMRTYEKAVQLGKCCCTPKEQAAEQVPEELIQAILKTRQQIPPT